MKFVDKLIREASGSNRKWSMLAFVDAKGGGFEASWGFWNGVPGTGAQYSSSSQHETVDEAIEAIKQTAQAFSFRLSRVDTIVDDCPGGDSVGQTP